MILDYSLERGADDRTRDGRDQQQPGHALVDGTDRAPPQRPPGGRDVPGEVVAEYHAAPTKVPTCNATSNVLLRLGGAVSSVHLNSSGTRVRWALDEIGRKSGGARTLS